MMKKLYLAVAILLAMPWKAEAQVFMQNTMFPFTKFTYNPASAGATGVTNLTSMFRKQWAGIPGSPTSFTLSGDAPVAKLRGGVGGYAISDKLGPISTTGLNMSYAFRFRLAEDDENSPNLAVGAQVGFANKAINGNFQWDRNNGIDPIFGQAVYAASTIVPNLAAGVYFSGPGDKYYAGLSVQDLLAPSIASLFVNGTAKAKVPRSYNIMGGYTFDLKKAPGGADLISLQPNLMIQTDGVSVQTTLNALVNVKPMVFGLGYRGLTNVDGIMGIMGFNVSDRFFFGYSYDYTLSGLGVSRDIHSHELVLSYRFPNVTKNPVRIEGLFPK